LDCGFRTRLTLFDIAGMTDSGPGFVLSDFEVLRQCKQCNLEGFGCTGRSDGAFTFSVVSLLQTGHSYGVRIWLSIALCYKQDAPTEFNYIVDWLCSSC